MDGSIKHKRELNPSKHAMLLSKITFFFAFSIFRRFGQKNSKDNDVYQILNEFSSKTLGDKLEDQWTIEKKKDAPNFVRSIFKVFGLEYILWGVLIAIVDISLMVIKPLLTGKVVAYFAPRQTKITKETVVIYSVLLLGCIFANIIFSHTYTFVMKQLCLKISISSSTVIYRKVLKLKNCSNAKTSGGKAVTLITRDISIFEQALLRLHSMIVGTIQIIVMTYMVYIQIGVSAFVGVSIIVLFIAIQAFIGSQCIKYRLATAQKTDERIQLTQEILSAIRVIKMYTWEAFFYKSVDKLRRKEIRYLQLLTCLKSIALALGLLNSKLALYGCVITFVALGNHINAEKAFVVAGCFTSLRTLLQVFMPLAFIKLAELKASIFRISKYLLQDEVADNMIREIGDHQGNITLKNVSVSYENQVVLKDISAVLKPGLKLVTGPIGSGKTTLLKAILGDVTTTGRIEIHGKVSYASQDPWLFPGTVRQNIIFNEPFNKSRYEEVIRACALEKDLESFRFGDETVLIDGGLNLSKGQKVRINLARAIYKIADIYLLDDVLSSVDPKVGKHIFSECIKVFLQGKLCLLVSHLNYYEPDEILLLNKGSLNFCGSYDQLKGSDETATERVINCEIDDVSVGSSNTTTGEKNESNTDKNIYEEKKEEGTVNKDVYYEYLKAGGIKFFLAVAVLAVLRQGTETWSDYFIRFWVESEQNLATIEEQYSTNSSEYTNAQSDHNGIISQYSLVIVGAVVFVITQAVTFLIFTGRASVNLHRQLMNKIINAVMAFFDKHLAGNVINRLSRDFNNVDEHLPLPIQECIRVTLTLAAIIAVVSTVNPWFLIPSVCFTAILCIARRLYVPSGRNIRRIEGSTRSPVIGHMQATFDGLTTIRASEAQKIITEEFDNHHDIYNSTRYMTLATVEAFSFYIDVLTGFYIAIIVFTLIFIGNSLGAGQVGLAITQSFALTGLLQWCVFQWSELEIQMTSTERVLEYIKLETENKDGNAIENWPRKGKIVYKDVCLKYTDNPEPVLRNINFTMESGEKLGIIGRTGAGKSSIISSLFRLYPFEGSVLVDDVDIKTLQVEELRSKMSIMPQDPILFSGTIRSNLDPKSQYTDEVLWNALQEVDMKNSIDSLDQPIKENSGSFSLGQKQLICLARIILQDNSILVLDEATANVDATAESQIQHTIEKRCANITVIIIAHRLHTVMDCNKVLVMDAGMVQEYDTVQNLLNNEQSSFYNMVKEAGLLT